MMEKKTYSLLKPDIFHMVDESGKTFFGCDQKWYRSFWQRMAGCGPSVASNLLYYMHKSQSVVLPFDLDCQSDCVGLMESVWKHVTPGTQGLNTIRKFCDGMHGFADENNYEFECFSLEYPKKAKDRPELTTVVKFIAEGLLLDCPVAFLNLASGSVKALDDWHWVTIVSLDVEDENQHISAKIYDGAQSIDIDLKAWCETTTLGGGFVYFKIKPKKEEAPNV
jgi:hypothetical protein